MIYFRRKICDQISLVYCEAEKDYYEGDEEKSYILYLKGLNLCAAINKAPEFKNDRKYIKDMVGKKYKEALNKFEKLQEGLKNRLVTDT